MDQQRFDGLTRRLAQGVSRRRMLKGFGLSAASGLLAFFGGKEAAAAPPPPACRPSTNGCVGACACPQGQVRNANCECECACGTVLCGGQCVSLCAGEQQLNPNTCTCVCPAGEELCQSSCLPSCPSGRVRDPGTCQCTCPPITCPGAQVLNPNTCACECPPTPCGGGRVNPTTCQCTCFQPEDLLVDNTCVRTCDSNFRCPQDCCECQPLVNGQGEVCVSGDDHTTIGFTCRPEDPPCPTGLVCVEEPGRGRVCRQPCVIIDPADYDPPG